MDWNKPPINNKNGNSGGCSFAGTRQGGVVVARGVLQLCASDLYAGLHSPSAEKEAPRHWHGGHLVPCTALAGRLPQCR